MDSTVAFEEVKRSPSRQSEHGLDWFAFFLADIQTGWGPFVAAYLTSQSWAQLDIGLILTAGTLAAVALQIPIGALVDHIPSKRLLAAVSVAAISGSALILALWPVFSVVLAAKLLHAIASCLAGPALAAMSLGLVGHALLANRLGRNVRFLSLGNAIAAGLMGGVAHYYSNQAIFFLTAAFGIPALIALALVRADDIDPDLARGGVLCTGAAAAISTKERSAAFAPVKLDELCPNLHSPPPPNPNGTSKACVARHQEDECLGYGVRRSNGDAHTRIGKVDYFAFAYCKAAYTYPAVCAGFLAGRLPLIFRPPARAETAGKRMSKGRHSVSPNRRLETDRASRSSACTPAGHVTYRTSTDPNTSRQSSAKEWSERKPTPRLDQRPGIARRSDGWHLAGVLR